MSDVLGEFLSGLDAVEDWRLDDVVGEPATTKRSGLPAVSWTRSYLRSNGPTALPVLLAAGRRAGYEKHLIEGCLERNSKYFVKSGDIWAVRPNSIEWIATFLAENGECSATAILREGEAAGFRPGTLFNSKCEVPNLKWRKVGRESYWRIER